MSQQMSNKSTVFKGLFFKFKIVTLLKYLNFKN